jgi:hypothetical protein
MPKFRVTYEIVTPESAEQSDVEEHGFMQPGGWHIPIEQAMAAKDEDFSMSLREALNLCDPQEDCGQWFCERDDRHDYVSGEDERRSLHPPINISDASYKRIKRLLKIR